MAINLKKYLYQNKSNKKYLKLYYICGLIYYKENKQNKNYEFRIFGFPFLKKKVKQGFEKFYLFGVAYFKKSSRKLLYKKVIEEISEKYKHIYINFNCSGETYLFLTYLYPPKDSVFIATKKYHEDLCKMLHPEIDCIYLPDVIHLRSVDNVYTEKYKGRTFYNIFPFMHFVKLEKNIRKDLDIHYCKEICKTMGIEYSIIAKLPLISEDVKSSALKKMHRIGLNLDKFVFLCPESQSNEDPADDFWINIIENYYNKGYDVFLNVINLQPKYGTAKTCFLTFEEAYYIASLSKEIIGLRSGFIEYLTSIQNVPITCYYSDFKDRGILPALDAKRVLKGFSLKYLPNVNIDLIQEEIIK